MTSRRKNPDGIFVPSGANKADYVDEERVPVTDVIAEDHYTHDGGVWNRVGNDGVNERGTFHCPRCIGTPHDSSFEKIGQPEYGGGWNDWFVHNAAAGGPCEGPRAASTPTRTLQWRYLWLTDPIKIEGEEHKVLMHLTPPIGDRGTLTILKRRIMDTYDQKMHWVTNVAPEDQQNDWTKLLLGTLKETHEREDSAAFVVGFPKSIANNMTERFNNATTVGANIRYVLKSLPQPNDEFHHLRIFEEPPTEPLRDEVLATWPDDQNEPLMFSPVRTRRVRQRIEFHPTSEDAVVVADVGRELNLDDMDTQIRFRTIVFLAACFCRPTFGSVTRLTDVINEGPYSIDPTSIQLRGDISAIPRHVPQQQNFTHVVLQPKGVRRRFIFVQSGARMDILEAIDADDNEDINAMYNAEYQTERKTGNFDHTKRIQVLNIRGNGYFTILGEGLSKKGRTTFVRAAPTTHDCRRINEELGLDAHISILKSLVLLAEYEAPSCIDEHGIKAYVDMFRHIAHQVLNENIGMPTNRLSRTLSLFRDLTTEEDTEGSGPARDVLSSIFEVEYGAWGIDEEHTEGIPRPRRSKVPSFERCRRVVWTLRQRLELLFDGAGVVDSCMQLITRD